MIVNRRASTIPPLLSLSPMTNTKPWFGSWVDISIYQESLTMVDAKSPSFWSHVYLYNMTKIGKERTTMLRVLESLFRFFLCTENTHLLLCILIKHLDHKNVLKKPDMQLDIVEVTTSLAQETKKEALVATI